MENVNLNRVIDSTLLSRRIYNRYLYCIQHLEISLVLDSTGEMVLAQAQNFDFEIRTFFVCLAAMTSVSATEVRMAILYCMLFGDNCKLQGRCVFCTFQVLL